MNASDLLKSKNFVSKGKKGCGCNPKGQYHLYHMQGDRNFIVKLYYSKKRFVISKTGHKTKDDIFPQLPKVLEQFLHT